MEKKIITVTVKLFAVYQEVYQQDQIILSVPSESRVIEILNKIIKDKPDLEQWRNLTRLAVNLDFVTEDFILHQGDEIALIPPVSGG
jgi:molybdopterin converting factor subunit 1